MSNTALIIRDPSTPKLRVLEVDGPLQKYTQRGEGRYYLSTNNNPPFCNEFRQDAAHDPIFADWDKPSWEIYQMHDGRVEIHANRPTTQEISRGDLHGRWGTVLYLRDASVPCIKTGLSVARMFMRCIPTDGITLNEIALIWFLDIVTDIPIRTWSHFPQFPWEHPTMPKFNRSQSAQ